MNMTPKKILSLPVYGSGTTLGLIAAILLLPGGLIMAIALGCYWLADKMSDDDDEDYVCDMTIKEYEECFQDIAPTKYPTFDLNLQTCGNCEYADACLTADDDWCDKWEKEQD